MDGGLQVKPLLHKALIKAFNLLKSVIVICRVQCIPYVCDGIRSSQGRAKKALLVSQAREFTVLYLSL